MIKDKQILRSIFWFKGNFAEGIAPPKRIFDGIEIAPFWNDYRAAVSISADFELNWAFRSLAVEHRDQLGNSERKNIPYIIDLLNEFNVPVTWATVGHLFLTSCRCEGDCAHPDMPRPPLNTRWQGDWYKHDPCTDSKRDPLWYAPDLIEQIIKSKVPHEIGSHTFSHIDFSPDTCTRELVRREMEESLDAMAPFSVTLKSLVFPFNQMGPSYHDVLHQFGIIAVRYRDNKIRLSYPERSASGIYKIYESMNLRSPNHYEYRDKAELFIKHAIERRAAYHLWFHPSDPQTVFDKELRGILHIIQHERERGNVWVTTMGALAAYCEARECISIQSKSEEGKTVLYIKSALDTAKYGIPEITFLVPSNLMPRRVDRQISGRFEQATAACVRKNGTLIVNLPAVTQIVTLSF